MMGAPPPMPLPMGPPPGMMGPPPGMPMPAPGPAPPPAPQPGVAGAFEEFVKKQAAGEGGGFDGGGYRGALSSWHKELLNSLRAYRDVMSAWEPGSGKKRPADPDLRKLLAGRPDPGAYRGGA
jgi:hypothetical protein